jgi:secreted trypsin-like serine protease
MVRYRRWGLVDQLMHVQGSSSELHTVVGYGLQSTKPRLSELLTRYRGSVVLKNASNPNGTSTDFVQISSNSTKNYSGGTCTGDSGGPLFLRDTNVVLAVTSFGTSVNCSGNSVSYRVDVASARTFLAAFVSVP